MRGLGRVAFVAVSAVVGALLLTQLIFTNVALDAMRESGAEATRESFGYVGDIVADHVLDQTREIEQQLLLTVADVEAGRVGASAEADAEELVSRIATDVGTRAILVAVPGEHMLFARRDGAGYLARVYDFDEGTALTVTYDAELLPVSRAVSDLTTDIETRGWYLAATEAGQGNLAWTEPELGTVTGDSNVWAAAPAFRDGEQVAVVAVGLQLSAINSALDNLPVGDSRGEAFVLTASRTVVAVPSSRAAEFDEIADRTGEAVSAAQMGIVTDAAAGAAVGASVFGADGEVLTLERRLSDSRGLDWVLHVRAENSAVLPGLARVESALNAMAAVVIVAIVMGAVGVALLRNPYRRIQRRAATDPLTGVGNRHTLVESGKSLVASAARQGAQVGVAVFDVDNFKKLNDNFGHDVGDEAILRIAEALQRETRQHDLVARLGGDEFVAVLTLPAGARVEGAVERLRDILELELTDLLSRVPDLGVTAGFSQSRGDFYGTVESLLHEADQALVRGKRRGKGATYRHQVESSRSS